MGVISKRAIVNINVHATKVQSVCRLHSTDRGSSEGGQIQELVSLVDLPPTLLDAAGLAVPDEMQGRSVLPLLRGETADWPEEVFVQISEAQVGRAVRTQRWKYGVDAPNKGGGKDAGSDIYVEQYPLRSRCRPL